MLVSLNAIDTRALGRVVLDISGFTRDVAWGSFESAYRAEHQPTYVSVKVPIEDLVSLHELQAHGFELAEVQLRLTNRLRSRFETKGFPYIFERVTTEAELKPVCEIASTTFVDDRFSRDPKIPAGISAARYVEYVEKSFANENERVYVLKHSSTGEVAAFKTHRILPEKRALHLLGGVRPEFKGTHIPLVNSYHELNTLFDAGVKNTTTNVSARNYGVVNLELGAVGFRVEAAFVVLRKWYA